MAKTLVVEIVGDAASFTRAVDQASNKSNSFSRKFSGMAKTMALGAGAAGVGAAVIALKGVIGAAQDAEKAEVRFKQAMETVHATAKQRAAAQEAVNATSRRAALDDEDLSDVLAKLTRSTGDVGKATEGMGLAADIARGRNISLEAAAKTVEKAMMGNATALKKVGVEVQPVTEHMDALKEKIATLKDALESADGPAKKHLEAQLAIAEGSKKAAKEADKQATSTDALAQAQKTFAGDAEAYGKTTAGAQEKAKVAFENLQESIGKKLLPILTQLAIKLTDLIAWAEENWPKFQKAMEPVFDIAKALIDNLITRIKDVAEVIKDVIKLITDIKNGEWGKVWGDLKKLAVDEIQLIVSTFLAIPLKLLGLAKDLGDKAFDRIKEEIGNLGSWIKGKVDDMIGYFTGMPGRIASAIEGAAEGAADRVKDAVLGIFQHLPGFVKSALGISSPSKVFEMIGEAIISGAVKGIKNKAGDLIDAAWNAFDKLGGRAYGSAQVMEIGRRLAGLRGWGTGAQWDALVELWNNESGWNPEAVNPESGAGGIPQALPSSKMGQAGMPQKQGGGGNPAVQIQWGLDYIAARYGTPAGALSFWQAQSPHWYAKGGVFTQPSIIGVGEAGPEAVIPLGKTLPTGGGVTFNNYAPIWSEKELANTLRALLYQVQNRQTSLGFR